MIMATRAVRKAYFPIILLKQGTGPRVPGPPGRMKADKGETLVVDTLSEKIAAVRVRDTQDQASAEVAQARAKEHQRREETRARNRELWIQHFERLAAGLRVRAEDYERRAKALLGEGRG